MNFGFEEKINSEYIRSETEGDVESYLTNQNYPLSFPHLKRKDHNNKDDKKEHHQVMKIKGKTITIMIIKKDNDNNNSEKEDHQAACGGAS